MSNQGQGSSVFGAIIVIAIIIGFFRCVVCDDESAGSSSQATQKDPKHDHDAVMAWIMCENFVKRNLKSPSTASFGGVFDGDYQDPKTHAIHKGGGEYICRGFVDAQNSFGAKIRSQFVVTVKYDGKTMWNLVEGPVIQ